MPERVAVCIATYRRPRALGRLLLSLDGLAFAAGEAPEVELLVVDNDAEGSAAAVCDAVRPRVRWPLRYVREPRRGISQARNRALACALERADHVAFLDDDQTAAPGWLAELLRVRAAYGADAVAGPVLPRFEDPPPAWVLKGRFFDLPRHPTGHRLAYCGTGNVLLRGAAVAGMEPRFDERLGLAGGEDTDFFLRFTAAGRVLVWADGAVAHEWIPPSRARARWILQREYRRANTWSHCERELLAAPGRRAARAVKGVLRIAQGLALLPLGLGGRHVLVDALRRVWLGAGSLAGVAGLRYQEYRVTHGR